MAGMRTWGRTAAEGRGAPLLAFVHIPKTAGATIKSMFTGAYSPSGVHDAGNYLLHPEPTFVKVATFEPTRGSERVIVGHVPYGLFREHLPRDTEYMTFLREPVDRVLSHYHRHVHRTRIRRQPIIDPIKAARDQLMADSLEEALDRGLPALNNLATRMLCGHSQPLGDLPASALDDAKANLRDFAFVGITERFEESFGLLQRMLGLGSVPYEERHVNLSRPSLEETPAHQRKLILDYNRLDVELYAFGRTLFADTVAAAGKGFIPKVNALIRGLAVPAEIDPAGATPHQDQPPERIQDSPAEVAEIAPSPESDPSIGEIEARADRGSRLRDEHMKGRPNKTREADSSSDNSEPGGGDHRRRPKDQRKRDRRAREVTSPHLGRKPRPRAAARKVRPAEAGSAGKDPGPSAGARSKGELKRARMAREGATPGPERKPRPRAATPKVRPAEAGSADKDAGPSAGARPKDERPRARRTPRRPKR